MHTLTLRPPQLFIKDGRGVHVYCNNRLRHGNRTGYEAMMVLLPVLVFLLGCLSLSTSREADWLVDTINTPVSLSLRTLRVVFLSHSP